MPAPSKMVGRQAITLGSVERSNSESDGLLAARREEAHGAASNLSRRSSDPVTAGSSATSVPLYDEVFISKGVSEIKTMLWEIKDFDGTYQNRVERAMNFEFEVGRLGSVEKHLPRRSRWKILLDCVNDGGRIPALRILQLSPESRTVFYRLEAWVMDGSSGAGIPEKETGDASFKTENHGFREGRNDSQGEETLVPFVWNPTVDFLDSVKQYLGRDGSLFVKVKIEILEDVSSH